MLQVQPLLELKFPCLRFSIHNIVTVKTKLKVYQVILYVHVIIDRGSDYTTLVIIVKNFSLDINQEKKRGLFITAFYLHFSKITSLLEVNCK